MILKQCSIPLIILALSLAVSGCRQGTPSSPGATPEATSTPTPTIPATVTVAPTRTATRTPTILPTLELEAALKVGLGGFSFQAPPLYHTQINQAQATVGNSDGTILISMASATPQAGAQSLQAVLDTFMGNIAGDFKDFTKGEPQKITIDGVAGLTVGITGVLDGDAITGSIVVAGPQGALFFYLFGLAVNGGDGKRWEQEGRQVYEAVLGSVKFFEPVSGANACSISTDTTYGFSMDNPIKVDGGDFGGPGRERAYLDNLLGPNGEKVSYERSGSQSYGNTILDIFVIKGLQKSVTLYIDEYSYTEPQAPVGFTCLSIFPLTSP